jgi:uncharacterized protein (DUF2141 family)
MIYRKISLIGFFCLGFCSFLTAQNLTVKLEQISSSKGKMMLALFNKESGFPGTPKNAFKILQIPANKPSVIIMFDQIPPGTYALAVFHDVNEDGELNTNFLGVPKEVYGFSNNARSRFRAPTFNEAAFEFSGQKSISVTIR